ncbi:hypothetical protein M514_05497 [Trichuris suis]|uniref:Uncharacterized protein n=1 Tax=Trichuris suis TaxID=68888 RepID=A0A085M8N5_9BILA|nr:hypothetical protein M513_05497 [Trichuris suis]KFD62802.1 hypothetical protein M514_05497 [Trichuris suis]KHJ47001.1 hypothetical protein D918_02546 [Trichuris suis]
MDEWQPADSEFDLSNEQEQTSVVIVVVHLNLDDVIVLYQLIPCTLGPEEGTVVSESGEIFWLNDGEIVYLHTGSVGLSDETEVISNSSKEVESSICACDSPNVATEERHLAARHSETLITLKSNPRSFTDCDRLMLRYGVKKFGEDWKYLLDHFEWSVPWMESDLEAEWKDMQNEGN